MRLFSFIPPEGNGRYLLFGMAGADVFPVPKPVAYGELDARFIPIVLGCLLLYLKKVSCLVFSEAGQNRRAAAALYIFESVSVTLISLLTCWFTNSVLTGFVFAATFAVFALSDIIVIKTVCNAEKGTGRAVLHDILSAVIWFFEALVTNLAFGLLSFPKRVRILGDCVREVEHITDAIILLSLLVTCAFASSIVKKFFSHKRFPEAVRDGIAPGLIFLIFNFSAAIFETAFYLCVYHGDWNYPLMLAVTAAANLVAAVFCPVYLSVRKRKVGRKETGKMPGSNEKMNEK